MVIVVVVLINEGSTRRRGEGEHKYSKYVIPFLNSLVKK